MEGHSSQSRMEWDTSQNGMEWHSSQSGRNDTVHEVDLQVSKSGQFPVADIKGSGT